MTATVLAGPRRLGWVTWRQHRTGLVAVLALFGLTAAFMAATELNPSWHADATSTSGPYNLVYPLTFLDLLLLPVMAGMVLGAPMLAHEAESGLTRFAWTQDVGKVTLLIGKALSVAAVLAVTAAGLGWEFNWWAGPVLKNVSYLWLGIPFSFHPLPYAGWTVFALCLGVALGALFRRTVPAVAGTLIGYAAVFYLDNYKLRPFYLPPLRSTVPWASTDLGLGFSTGHIGRYVIDSGIIGPGGKQISYFAPGQRAGWVNFAGKHVAQWMTYQPASRYHLFQVLEFGYLMLLSAALVAAAVVLIRRRSA